MTEKPPRRVFQPDKPEDTKDQRKLKESQRERFEEYVNRSSSPSERDYVREMLLELIENNVLNLDLIEYVPQPAKDIKKTRFDQLYDAAMYLVFPDYNITTLRRFLGAACDENPHIKIWRCVFPQKLGLTNVLIRANSFQEAFAYATDYACRMNLRIYRKIPLDMTIRVQFVSERSMRRMVDIRWANKNKRRHQLKTEGREFTNKEMFGARLVAIGHKEQPGYNIFHYAEYRDLKRIFQHHKLVRVSKVEKETFDDELPEEYILRKDK